MVFVDRPPLGLSADCFLEDDHSGAYAATMHLIEHGHRRIGFLGDHAHVPTTRGRLEGYRSALEDRGITVDEELIMLQKSGREGAGIALADWRAWPRRPRRCSPPTPE